MNGKIYGLIMVLVVFLGLFLIRSMPTYITNNEYLYMFVFISYSMVVLFGLVKFLKLR